MKEVKLKEQWQIPMYFKILKRYHHIKQNIFIFISSKIVVILNQLPNQICFLPKLYQNSIVCILKSIEPTHMIKWWKIVWSLRIDYNTSSGIYTYLCAWPLSMVTTWATMPLTGASFSNITPGFSIVITTAFLSLQSFTLLFITSSCGYCRYVIIAGIPCVVISWLFNFLRRRFITNKF